MKRCLALLVLGTTVLACGDSDDGSSGDSGVDGAVDGSRDGASNDGGVDDAGGDAQAVELDLRYLPTAKPGTRLQPRVINVDGAPDIFLNWYDSVLEIECDMRAATDGELRCLPVHSVNPTTVRLSNNCTGGSGLLEVAACGQKQFDMLGESLDEELVTCENNGFGARVQQWTSEPWSGGYSVQGEVCEAFEEAPEGALSLLSQQTLEPSVFVKMTTEREALDNGLEAWLHKAEDGASRILTIASVEGGPCIARTDGSKTVCAPSQRKANEEGSGTFTDSACTQFAAFSGEASACAEDPLYAETRSTGDIAVMEIGEELTGDTTVYVKVGEDCEARTVTQLKEQKPWVRRLFAISDQRAQLPSLLPVAIGEGSMKARFYATPEGVVVAEGFVDHEVFPGADLRVHTLYEQDSSGCVVWPTPTDGLRCIPAGAALEISDPPRFSDDTCSTRVAHVGSWTLIAETDPTLVYALEQTSCTQGQGGGQSTSQVLSSLWSVTGKIEANSQPIYEQVDGACELAEVPDNVHFTLESLNLVDYPGVTTSLVEP